MRSVLIPLRFNEKSLGVGITKLDFVRLNEPLNSQLIIEVLEEFVQVSLLLTRLLPSRHNDTLGQLAHERFQIITLLPQHDQLPDLSDLVSTQHLRNADDLHEGDQEERRAVRAQQLSVKVLAALVQQVRNGKTEAQASNNAVAA